MSHETLGNSLSGELNVMDLTSTCLPTTNGLMTYNLILFHLCERVILFSSVASYYFSGSYIPSALFGENEVSSSRICVQHRYKSFLISTAESLFTVWLLLIATLWMESAAQAQVVPLAVAAFPGNTVVGQQATPLTVTVTVVHSDTASAPIVITQGNANLDFKPAGSGSCASGCHLFSPLSRPSFWSGCTDKLQRNGLGIHSSIGYGNRIAWHSCSRSH